MKRCTNCSKAKPVTEFNRNSAMRDGLNCWCKECKAEKRRALRAKPEARSRENTYLREWQRQPERKAYRNAYYTSPEVKERERIRSRERRADPTERQKIDARNAVAYALRTGRLERQPCERCGTADRIEAHHDDYLKPLEVRWFCAGCHEDHHVEERAA